jgi:hypothetical protein
VKIGTAVYQDSATGLRFEGKPLLLNTGHTPALKVKFLAKAAILPRPLPHGFRFPAPTEDATRPAGAAMLGAQQSANIQAVVNEVVPEAEVENIKLGLGRCLYIWGVVKYEDIFEEQHTTEFCQSLMWRTDGTSVFGFYTPDHNDAT